MNLCLHHGQKKKSFLPSWVFKCYLYPSIQSTFFVFSSLFYQLDICVIPGQRYLCEGLTVISVLLSSQQLFLICTRQQLLSPTSYAEKCSPFYTGSQCSERLRGFFIIFLHLFFATHWMPGVFVPLAEEDSNVLFGHQVDRNLRSLSDEMLTNMTIFLCVHQAQSLPTWDLVLNDKQGRFPGRLQHTKHFVFLLFWVHFF